MNAAEWARDFLGIEGAGDMFAQPADAAQRLGAATRSAAAGMPFGAEPPDFTRLLEELAGDE